MGLRIKMAAEFAQGFSLPGRPVSHSKWLGERERKAKDSLREIMRTKENDVA